VKGEFWRNSCGLPTARPSQLKLKTLMKTTIAPPAAPSPRTAANPAPGVAPFFGLHFGPARPPPNPCAPRAATARITWSVWHLLLFLLLPSAVRAQFTYTTKNGTITITGGCRAGAVVIPSQINGLPVTNIGDSAFADCTRLTSITFQGNMPSGGSSVFQGATQATVYYLPGATGWAATFGGRPAVLWNLLIQTGGADFGRKAGAFGFNVTGTSPLSFVVEASSDMAQPVWSIVSTNTLVTGTAYFSDPKWVGFSTRVFRVRPQ